MPRTDNTPSIIRETSSGYDVIRIQDEMLRNREIECVGEIDEVMVYSISRQLRYLAREDPFTDITLYINSPGGDVVSGLALYDVMRGIPCQVRTVCLGRAASMGAVLFAAGDSRDILPHGSVMIHDPLMQGVGGSALRLREISDELMRVRTILCEILARHTGRTLEEVYDKTQKDSFFTAEAAVEFGLADRIIQSIL